MENKNFILCLFAGLAFGNNSMIASKDNNSNGSESTINNTKSQDDNKFSEINNRDQYTKNLNDKKEENDKLQLSFASQNFSINFNLKNIESSFKKKLNEEKISGDVLSVEGDFMMSFLKDITYKSAFPATFGDASTFCDDKKIMIFSDTEKWKKTGGEVLSWFLDVERKLSIYGYEITQRISPFSVKSDAGYRVNLFSLKNVFNVLNRLSCTSLNPGCMDILNVSIMRTDAYLKDKKVFSTEGRKLVGLCIDVFSVNKKFSNLLEIGFVFGTHYSLEAAKGLDQFLENAALQFSLNCTCKYIFMKLKLIGYRNSNNIMCNNKTPLNIYLGYRNKDVDGCIVPVKIKLGSSILKGKRVAAFGRNSLICKDICLDIKSNIFFPNNSAVLFSYDLSLTFSLEKYIDIALGICSHSKGLKLYGEVGQLVDDKNDAYGDISRWIYLPVPYLKIQINWLEFRK